MFQWPDSAVSKWCVVGVYVTCSDMSCQLFGAYSVPGKVRLSSLSSLRPVPHSKLIQKRKGTFKNFSKVNID